MVRYAWKSQQLCVKCERTIPSHTQAVRGDCAVLLTTMVALFARTCNRCTRALSCFGLVQHTIQETMWARDTEDRVGPGRGWKVGVGESPSIMIVCNQRPRLHKGISAGPEKFIAGFRKLSDKCSTESHTGS